MARASGGLLQVTGTRDGGPIFNGRPRPLTHHVCRERPGRRSPRPNVSESSVIPGALNVEGKEESDPATTGPIRAPSRTGTSTPQRAAVPPSPQGRIPPNPGCTGGAGSPRTAFPSTRPGCPEPAPHPSPGRGIAVGWKFGQPRGLRRENRAMPAPGRPRTNSCGLDPAAPLADKSPNGDRPGCRSPGGA
jgi:hypothetical protein